jgi:hypothetical protein
MSDNNEENSSGEQITHQCSDKSFKLKVQLSLESEDEETFASLNTEATIPLLLSEDYILTSEPRFRKQLETSIEPFKLIVSSKLNKVIELAKEDTTDHRNSDVDVVEEYPSVDIE